MVTCKLCDRQFRNQSSLNTHVRDCHDGDKARLIPLKCAKDDCTTACWSRPYFMKHLAKHGYSSSAAARIADRAGHGSGPPVTPPTVSDLSQGSSGGGAYMCFECEETFVALVDLDVHLDGHQNDSLSSMSVEDQVSVDSYYDTESSAQNTSLESMDHQTNSGAQGEQEEEEIINESTKVNEVNKMDQLKHDLERASGSHYITEFVLRFLKPAIMKNSGKDIAVYMPKSPEELSGDGLQDET
ncbi:hypothetical protein BGZ82_003096 [Podila clonocystis]|nr:hypothetical protein BGZ82_003096 [Podila clonocystis]